MAGLLNKAGKLSSEMKNAMGQSQSVWEESMLRRIESLKDSIVTKTAEQIYQSILSEQPQHADALHLYGVLLHTTGQSQDGIKLIKRAIKVNNKIEHYHYNLAVVLQANGQVDKAIQRYRQTIKLSPRHLAHHNLAQCYADKGMIEAAEQHYRTALKFHPQHNLLRR